MSPEVERESYGRADVSGWQEEEEAVAEAELGGERGLEEKHACADTAGELIVDVTGDGERSCVLVGEDSRYGHEEEGKEQGVEVEEEEVDFGDAFEVLVKQSRQIPEYSSPHHRFWRRMKDAQKNQDPFPLQKMQQQGHDDKLMLSIGGSLFETTRQTLTTDMNSMLAAWVLRHLNHGETELWLDRDGNRFVHVLNYLRNGTIFLDDIPSLRGVQEEAIYYGLVGLQALCEEKIRHVEKREEDLSYRRSQEIGNAVKLILQAFDDANVCAHRKGRGSLESVIRGNDPTRDEPVFQLDADF